MASADMTICSTGGGSSGSSDGDGKAVSLQSSNVIHGHLLPGVTDEITINHILTRVDWKQLYELASVSSEWRMVLQNRDVYEARLRAKKTQTLVAMIHNNDSTHWSHVNALSLYDCLKNSWHLLPQIPSGTHSGIPEECGSVSLGGRLYIIGGRGRGPLEFRDEAYAFDLVGGTGWKQCASMISGRAAFSCEAKDGKIYAFGGVGTQGAAEVYIPEDDVWREIAPMPSMGKHRKVMVVGGEFYIQLGRIMGMTYISDTLPVDVYDPRTDRWRTVDNCNFAREPRAFVAQTMVVIDGHVHQILDDLLYMYDKSSLDWKVAQAISWDVFDSRTLHFADASSALFVNGELLALVYATTFYGYLELTPLRSEGLGLKDQELVWKRIDCSIGFLRSQSMCTVDL